MHRLGLSLIFTDALVGLRSSLHLLAQSSGSNQEFFFEGGECLHASKREASVIFLIESLSSSKSSNALSPAMLSYSRPKDALVVCLFIRAIYLTGVHALCQVLMVQEVAERLIKQRRVVRECSPSDVDQMLMEAKTEKRLEEEYVASHHCMLRSAIPSLKRIWVRNRECASEYK